LVVQPKKKRHDLQTRPRNILPSSGVRDCLFLPLFDTFQLAYVGRTCTKDQGTTHMRCAQG
jgi:hypothetical protein